MNPVFSPKTWLIGATIMLSVGCVTPSNLLFEYGHYPDQTYAYLQGKSVETQIEIMKLDLAAINQTGRRIAPGFHAHLGLLYEQTGNLDQTVEHLLTEKRLFPESATYIDFLLKRLKTNTKTKG
jgi:hypothetical protein